MKIMKQVLLASLLLGILLSLTACIPPNEYSRKHYTYEDVVACAKAIDPDAVVYETCTVVYEGYTQDRREWDAVINGIECHVVSIRSFYGELQWPIYEVATDYEWCLLERILSEMQPDWSVKEPTNLYQPYLYRYGLYHELYIETSYVETAEEFDDEKLEQLWVDVCEIATAYNEFSGNLHLQFGAATMPGLYTNKNGEKYVAMSLAHIWQYSEEAKQEFFDRYREGWDLLESGLPIVD